MKKLTTSIFAKLPSLADLMPAGFRGLFAKSDGLYIKDDNQTEERLATMTDIANVDVWTPASELYDAIKIGGRNYCRDSARVIVGNYTNELPYPSLGLVVGTPMMISAWGKGGGKFGLRANGTTLFQGCVSFSFSGTTLYRQSQYAIIPATDSYLNAIISLNVLINQGSAAGTITKWQIEIGNKVTDWTPAPEDIDAAIALKLDIDDLPTSLPANGGTSASCSGDAHSVDGFHLNQDVTTVGNPTFQNIKPAFNIIRNNLGTPSVEEMAMFHAQFGNKLRFIPAIAQEESTDGITWIPSTRATANQLADIMIGEGQTGGIDIIPPTAIGGTGYYRMYWNAAQTGYINLAALYTYTCTNANNLYIKIEGCWTDTVNGNLEYWGVIVPEQLINNWPGHSYIPHTGIWFHPAGAHGTHHDRVRVTFRMSAANTIYGCGLYAIEWLGGFPAGRRNVEEYTRDKSVYFPFQVFGGSGRLAYVSELPSSLPANGGNAETVDGKHASEFANASETINFTTSITPTQTGTVAKTALWLFQYFAQSIRWLYLYKSQTGHTHVYSEITDLPSQMNYKVDKAYKKSLSDAPITYIEFDDINAAGFLNYGVEDWNARLLASFEAMDFDPLNPNRVRLYGNFELRLDGYFAGNYNLKKFESPICTRVVDYAFFDTQNITDIILVHPDLTLGADVASNNVFLNNFILTNLTVHKNLSIANSGAPEGDIAFLVSSYGTVVKYVDTLAVQITNLINLGFSHYIGEEFGDGIIVGLWKTAGVEHGLIVSKNDLASGQRWSDAPGDSNLVGANSTIDGQGNSIAMMNVANCAANICQNYVSPGGSYYDWYLPSMLEMRMCSDVATQLAIILGVDAFGFNNMSNYMYWTSTEADTQMAWWYDPVLNKGGVEMKWAGLYIRAVRQF